MLLDPKCNWQPFPVTTLVAYHPLNRHGRDYVIGDLHGQWQALQRALGEVAFDPARDRLFSVGDLADRGPDSLRCLQWACSGEFPFYPLRGNHEDLLLDAVVNHRHDPGHFWYQPVNGGEWGLACRHALEQLAPQIARWPLVRVVATSAGPVAIVHADLPVTELAELAQIGDDPLAQTHCLWSRRRVKAGMPWHSTTIQRLYAGHTTLPVITDLGQLRLIDTGAHHSGFALVPLSAG